MAIYVNGKLVAGGGGSGNGGGTLNPSDIENIVTMQGGGNINLVGEFDDTTPYNIEFRTEDEDPGDGVPKGGTTGQVLVKKSNTNYDIEWQTVSFSGDEEEIDLSLYAPKESPVFTGSISLGRKAETYVGRNSFAVGEMVEASLPLTHAEGEATAAINTAAHAEGSASIASGYAAHAEGSQTTASGNSSHAEGLQTKASGNYSHAEGCYTEALKIYSHAEGYRTTASGQYSHAEGSQTIASGFASHAEGLQTKALGDYAHSIGELTNAEGAFSHAEGFETIAQEFEFVIGTYNRTVEDGRTFFTIGYGIESGRSNVFRVSNKGIFGASSYNSSGADYAELFQWEDDNINQEDRCGRFVTLNGDKIRLADFSDDFILGVVSSSPSVIGDVYDDQWVNMYEKDIFGRIIWEDKEFPEKSIEIPDPSNPTQTIKQIIRPARIEKVRKLNPNYDNTIKYIPRSERPEWDAVGMLGKLIMVDDGTCEVNGYCGPGLNGIATSSISATRYRVMARLDDNHIKVLIL